MKLAWLTVLVFVIAMQQGCMHSTPNAVGPYSVFRNAGLHEVTRREYRVDPPDELQIKAPDIKELDGQSQVIRPDGKVSFELMGEVSVAGLTPVEIAQVLTEKASKFYVKPEVRVQVVANSKFYYVFGSGTGGQGKKPYTGRVTVISAIADAGYTPDAWPSQIRLSRPGRDGDPDATVMVDFTRMVSYADMTQNYLIEEGDVIEVPFHPLSYYNFQVNRLLSPFTGSAQLVTAPTQAANTFQNSTQRR